MYMYILAFSCSGYTLIYLAPPPTFNILNFTYLFLSDLTIVDMSILYFPKLNTAYMKMQKL